MNGTLFVVGTPIGNLEDISQRALKTLKEVDFIAAEDTRVTLKLLTRFQIKKPLMSYFGHNENEKYKLILEKIKNGENCAFVSDAGMPGISDPGENIVKFCYNKNITVKVIPSACACTSALAISGLSTGRFTFEGFLSVNKKARIKHLLELKNERRTIIFYEAPHKLLKTLIDLYEVLGERKISIVRELTKIFEEVKIMNLSEAIEVYTGKLKGEFVILIEGKALQEPKKLTINETLKIAEKYLANGMKITDAARETSKISGISKSEIYKNIIDLFQN